MARWIPDLGLWLAWASIGWGVWRQSGAWPALDLAATLVAGAGWLAAIRLAGRARSPFFCILIGACLLRVAPFVAGPVLSDDLQRYVWEGELVRVGIDPYAHAPGDPELAAARERWPELAARVAHPEVAAIYPPLAQAVHAGATALAPDPERAALLLRGFYLLCDLGVLLVLSACLRRRGRPANVSLVWAWCPLVAFEFAGAGHLDSLALLIVLLAWWLLPEVNDARARSADPRARGADGGARGLARELGAAAALTAAVLVKLAPLVLVPRWLAERERGRRWMLAGGMALALALACIPYASALGANGGLRQYGERWEGFNLGFRVLRAATLALAPPATDGLTLAHWARGAAAAVLILVLAVAWKRTRDSVDFGRTAVLACVLLAPVVHPWYLTWLLPCLCLRLDVELCWLVAVAPCLYAPLAGWQRGAGWIEPAWLWPVVAGPFALLLVLRLVRERRARPAA